MGSGRITREYTAWCFECENWVQVSANRIGQVERELKRTGWKKIRGLWTCPMCLSTKIFYTGRGRPPGT